MENAPIRVTCVDDHLMFLKPLSDCIDGAPDMTVVGTATNGDDALKVLTERQADVVILDVDIPGRSAFDVVDELSNRGIQTKVLFLSGHLSDVFLEQALRLNASGYILKGEEPQILLHAIRQVMAGETYFSQPVQERLVYSENRKRFTVKTETRLASLTTRQLEVLRYIAKGLTVKEVARIMHLSEKSIDSHKYRIMHKLGIHDRVELARYAIREGLTLP